MTILGRTIFESVFHGAPSAFSPTPEPSADPSVHTGDPRPVPACSTPTCLTALNYSRCHNDNAVMAISPNIR